MLRLIQKDNLLYITEQERTEYDLENTQLLYTFSDLTYDENIRRRVRPFRALWEKKKERYKKTLLNYIPDLLYSDYSPIPTSQEEHERVVEEVGKIALMMGYDASKVPADYNIQYECDTWNGLEDVYGEKLIDKFKEFLLLSSVDQELIRKVWLAPENRRTVIARSGNWESIVDLLPLHTQSELWLFGGDTDSAGKERSVLEFRRHEQLGPSLPNFKGLIYQEFHLGEFLLEGAQEIKDRLGKIYKICGIEKNPKAKDLDEWFVISPCRFKGKRGFRIDFRK